MSVQDEEDLWDDVGPSGDYTEAELRAAEALGSLLPENRNAEPTANVTAGSPPTADPPTAATLPPMLQNQEIIQEPDSPSEIIFLEDEDDYTGLINDGIGDDNDGAASDEEELQEEDIDQPDPGAAGGEDSDGSEGSTRQAKRSGGPAHALPDWLMNPFKENVAASAPRGKDRLPTLYREHRTFWFPTPDPFFFLEDLDSLAPEQLFSPFFFSLGSRCTCPWRDSMPSLWPSTQPALSNTPSEAVC
ncbi:hypothetical protein B0H11DRAFT_2306381 [Mycena galericulata]|nr:hypothetical protein B0H11DRAFT_2306381 [Mycena galericulata]